MDRVVGGNPVTLAHRRQHRGRGGQVEKRLERRDADRGSGGDVAPSARRSRRRDRTATASGSAAGRQRALHPDQLPEQLTAGTSGMDAVEGPAADQLLHRRPGEPGVPPELPHRSGGADIDGRLAGRPPGRAEPGDVVETEPHAPCLGRPPHHPHRGPLRRGEGEVGGGTALHPAAGPAPGDVDREAGDAVALAVVDQHRGVVEAHRLGVEQGAEPVGRVLQAQPGGLVDGPGEGGGVRLAEAELGEAGDAPEELLGDPGVETAMLLATADEVVVQRLHLEPRAVPVHGPPEAVGLTRAVAGELHDDAQDLLLVEDDPLGFRQNWL